MFLLQCRADNFSRILGTRLPISLLLYSGVLNRGLTVFWFPWSIVDMLHGGSSFGKSQV